jgi:hypothetical protein
MPQAFILLAILILTISCVDGDRVNPLDAHCVDYGGETYKTVVIGTQTWFARNLNYDPGPGTSWCYDNEPSNSEIYWRLYDWETATEVCPVGWHLPSDEEWTVLTDYIGSSDAATKLKSVSWDGTFMAFPRCLAAATMGLRSTTKRPATGGVQRSTMRVTPTSGT